MDYVTPKCHLSVGFLRDPPVLYQYNNALYYTLCVMSIVGCRNVPFIQTFGTQTAS